jgi:hypothetical protein
VMKVAELSDVTIRLVNSGCFCVRRPVEDNDLNLTKQFCKMHGTRTVQEHVYLKETVFP